MIVHSSFSHYRTGVVWHIPSLPQTETHPFPEQGRVSRTCPPSPHAFWAGRPHASAASNKDCFLEEYRQRTSGGVLPNRAIATRAEGVRKLTCSAAHCSTPPNRCQHGGIRHIGSAERIQPAFFTLGQPGLNVSLLLAVIPGMPSIFDDGIRSTNAAL